MSVINDGASSESSLIEMICKYREKWVLANKLELS